MGVSRFINLGNGWKGLIIPLLETEEYLYTGRPACSDQCKCGAECGKVKDCVNFELSIITVYSVEYMQSRRLRNKYLSNRNKFEARLSLRIYIFFVYFLYSVLHQVLVVTVSLIERSIIPSSSSISRHCFPNSTFSRAIFLLSSGKH